MADKNFVVKNGLVVNTDLIVANGESNRVGINNSAPDASLTVTGTANVSGNVALGSILAVTGNTTVGGAVTVSNSASISGPVTVGNSTVNTVVNSGTINTGNVTANIIAGFVNVTGRTNTATFFATTSANVGANVQLTTSALNVGNSTVNTSVNSSAIATRNVSANVIAGFVNVSGQTNTATFFATTSANVGANVQLTTSQLKIGNSTVNATVNSTIFTGTSLLANNSTNLSGQPGSYYTTYSDTAAATAYSNATAYADNKAANAYSNATSYADNKAATAYSNATAYADNKAATAYSNATSYADTKAATAYSNATTYADTAAATAYSNATSYADSKAATAYSNATTFASNATNLTTGTVPSARVSGSYTGITRTGTLTNFATSGNVALTNISSTTNATSNVITISSSNVNIDAGVLFVDSVNNRVGVNNTTPDSALTVTGNIKSSGDLIVGGNFTVNGTLTTAGTTEAAGNFLPALDNTYTLGNTSARWILHSSAANFANIALGTDVAANTTAIRVGTVTTNTSAISVGNSTVNVSVNSTTFSGTANNSTRLNGQLASYYTGYSDTAAANKAAEAYSNSVTYVTNRIIDSVTNTSITYAASANSVKTAYDAAVSAYSNATAYADSRSATAYSNAATFAANATNLTNGTVPSGRVSGSYTGITTVGTLLNLTVNNTITVTNSASATSVTINSTAFSGTADNANKLNGVAGANYVQNTDSRTLSGNLYFTGANVSYQTGFKVGANLVTNTSAIFVSSNSTVNTILDGGSLTITNSTSSSAVLNANELKLGNSTVNTSISVASFNAKAPVDSPTFTGTPSAPTPANTTNSTQLATTAYVKNVIGELIDSAPGTLDTLNELAAALGDDPNFATTMTNLINTKSGEAYTNATTFSANATNLTNGTVNNARLPSAISVTTLAGSTSVSVGANVIANTTAIRVGNSTVNVFMNSTTFNGTSNNASYLGGQLPSYYTGYSDTAAATAYSNATAYADTKSATAYSNATSYADTRAATAYSNATAYADTKSATAYSNATSYADTRAETAYSNATTFAANASNLNTGTVNNARLPAAISVTTLAGSTSVSVGNDVIANTTAIRVGNSTINATINSTTFSGTSNNSIYLDGTLASTYVKNTDSRTLSGNLYFTGANVSLLSGLKVGANLVIDTAQLKIGNSTVNASMNSTTFSGTANNASYFDGQLSSYYTGYSDTKAAAAYSNSVTYADTRAATAYSNATTFAANATNLTSGTVNNARLPSDISVSTLAGSTSVSVGANVIANTTTLFVGNSTFFTTANATNVESPRIRAYASGTANLTSTDHAFQTGNSSLAHIIFDGNDIQCRNSGAGATLRLNSFGGNLTIGNVNSLVNIPGITNTSNLIVTDFTDIAGVTITSGGLRINTTTSATDDIEVSKTILDLDTSRINVSGVSNTGVARSARIAVYKHSGITNPSAFLYLQQEDGGNQYYWTENSAGIGNLRTSTSAADLGTISGIVVGSQPSDERLKNIEDGFIYGMETVRKLKPIRFTYKDKPSKYQLGFGAQTTEMIVPESVYDTNVCIDGYEVDPDNDMNSTPKSNNTILAMEYVQLIPVLTAALQEADKKIQEMAAEIAILKSKIT